MSTKLKMFYNTFEAPKNTKYPAYFFATNKDKFCLIIILDENNNIYSIDWNTIDFVIGFKEINLYELVFDLNLFKLIYKIFFNTNVLGYFIDSYSQKIFNEIKEIIKEIFDELQIPA